MDVRRHHVLYSLNRRFMVFWINTFSGAQVVWLRSLVFLLDV